MVLPPQGQAVVDLWPRKLGNPTLATLTYRWTVLPVDSLRGAQAGLSAVTQVGPCWCQLQEHQRFRRSRHLSNFLVLPCFLCPAFRFSKFVQQLCMFQVNLFIYVGSSYVLTVIKLHVLKFDPTENHYVFQLEPCTVAPMPPASPPCR